MILQSPKNSNSHLTVKERKWPSFPLKELIKFKLVKGRVLDFGCGLGKDVSFLKSLNIDAAGYDPYYSPTYPEGKFDTILCLYVLNILLPEEQAHVLMAISEMLKPSGTAYFAVRRDIKHNGFRIHLKHKCPVYQCNVVLPFKSIIKTPHCEIYEYKHYNQLSKSDNANCPFCEVEFERKLITESATVYAIFDKFPVSTGHALIIPKKHLSNYFDLSQHDQTACWLVVNRVKSLLDKQLRPDGYNIGINVGSKAGQTIPHVHIHLIPRYDRDVSNPQGGVRHVIPGMADYTDKNN